MPSDAELLRRNLVSDQQDQLPPGYADQSEHSPSAFGRQLMLHRIALGWSRQDLSDAITALGLTDGRGQPVTVSAGAITRHENGNRQPRPRAVHAYRLALGLPVEGQAPDITSTQLHAAFLAARAHGKILADDVLRDIITAAASTG